jgi:putative transposase
MIQKSYKYRAYPTKEQEVLLAKHFGCSRWIYNYALDKKVKAYQTTKESLSRFTIQKDLVTLKKSEDTKWLKEVNSQTLQASLENLDKAFTKFFRDKKGFPKFKSKHNNHQSFSVPQNGIVDFETNTISLPKFKTPIKCKLHRKFEGNSKTVTVSKTPSGKYFISVLVEVNEELPALKPIDENKAVGIDLGIKTFAVLSNGDEIQNPRNLKKSLKKLKKLQRKVSKKVKGSNNRKKAVSKLAKMHEKVSNRRFDFLHKVTAKLVSENNTICLETLTASNMMKNHKLAQALSDISIGKFNEILEYKAKWNGVNILRIGQFTPSSRMCTCGVVNKELKLSDRVWTCKSCGVTHDRDELAANNIKKFAFINIKNTAGIVGFQACGDEGLPLSTKQEAHPISYAVGG